ncbi:hypothetical protein phiV141_4 [Vibrio phage phiV141]|uniref:Uncharacterized protein n=1 Tax=Vibrio phage phiV141 TaxID=2723905 RepID=A0A7D7FA84_9CAUD|nr:hypothetical protein phiV141_4 [Vibrio phage phiV141]
MFKNIGKALAIMLAGAGGSRALSTKKHDRNSAPSVFSGLYGAGVKRAKVKYTGGHSAKRTTAAAQKRAATKRANKRKNPKGSK